MDAPDDPITAALVVSTVVGVGTQAYGSKRARDQASDARDRQKRDVEKLEASGRENKLQGELGDSIAAERRRERARGLLASGRAGTIKTTPIGIVGDGSMAGPKYKIGA